MSSPAIHWTTPLISGSIGRDIYHRLYLRIIPRLWLAPLQSECHQGDTGEGANQTVTMKLEPFQSIVEELVACVLNPAVCLSDRWLLPPPAVALVVRWHTTPSLHDIGDRTTSLSSLSWIGVLWAHQVCPTYTRHSPAYAAAMRLKFYHQEVLICAPH